MLILLPWLAQPLQGRQPPAKPSARQARLEAFRDNQLQVRACKRQARAERLDGKRARLLEALERARDQVQFQAMREFQLPSGPAARPSLRRGLLGLGALGLLASAGGDPQGVVVAHFLGGPEPPASVAPVTMHELPGALTEVLMDQLDAEELENAGPMAERALQAQRTLMRNALGATLGFPLPEAGTPGAQLLQNAFQSTLADTALDIMTDILPAEFGPLPARRGGLALGGSERDAAWNALQAAKKDVVAAIREAKGVGSDIVVAATSLLGYGAFASVAYGLDIGASITGIFTSSPVSGAGIATGTLSAVANEFFLMAYAADAIAGAVLIHKLKEPYIDALLKVSDAETAWVSAYENYLALNRIGTGAAESGAAGTGATGATGTGATGAAGTMASEPAGSGVAEGPGTGAAEGPGTGATPAAPADETQAPLTIPRLPESLLPAGEPAASLQTSSAAPRAGPLRLGW